MSYRRPESKRAYNKKRRRLRVTYSSNKNDLWFKDINGNSTIIQAHNNDTIRNIIERLYDKLDYFTPYYYGFIFQRQVVQDSSKTVSDYQLHKSEFTNPIHINYFTRQCPTSPLVK